MKSFRAGVDIGGTFTDIVLLGDQGERYTKKVPSTVDAAATAKRRSEIKMARGWTTVPKVQWHDPMPLSRAAG